MKVEKGLLAKQAAVIQTLLAKNDLGPGIVEAVQNVAIFVANGLLDGTFGPNDFLQLLVLSKDIEFAKIQRLSQIERGSDPDSIHFQKKVGIQGENKALLSAAIQSSYNNESLSRKLNKGLPTVAWDALGLVISLLSLCEVSNVNLSNLFESAIVSWNNFSAADQVIIYELISSSLFFSVVYSTKGTHNSLDFEMITKFFELALRSQQSGNNSTFLRFAQGLQKLLLVTVYQTSLHDSEPFSSLPTWSMSSASMSALQFPTALSHIAESFFKATFILQRKAFRSFSCSNDCLETLLKTILELTANASTVTKTTVKLLVSIGTETIVLMKNEKNNLFVSRLIVSVMVALTRVHTTIEAYDYLELQDRWNKLLTALMQQASLLVSENSICCIVSNLDIDEELLRVIHISVLDLLPTMKNCDLHNCSRVLVKWLSIPQLMLQQKQNNKTARSIDCGLNMVDSISQHFIFQTLEESSSQTNIFNNKFQDFSSSTNIANLLRIIYHAWDNCASVVLSKATNNNSSSSGFTSLPAIQSLLTFINDCCCCTDNAETYPQYQINHSTVQRITHQVDQLLEKVSSRLFAHHLDYYIIKAWMCLFAARALFLLGNDLATAMIYAKKGYTYAHNTSVVGRHALIIVKLETSLLLLEFYEAYGKVSRAVDMLCDFASSSTMCVGRYRAVLYLLIVKVWARSESSRLFDLLQSMTNDNVGNGDILKLAVKQLFAAYPALKVQLDNAQIDLDLQSAVSSKTSSKARKKDQVDYRYINAMWTATGMTFTHGNEKASFPSFVIEEENVGIAIEVSMTCPFPIAKWIRKQLCSQLSSANRDKKEKESDDEDEFQISTVKSMRAPSHSSSSSASVRSNNDFKGFILGSSASFLTSWERTLIDKDPHHPAVTLLHDTMMKKDINAEEQIQSSLRTTLQSLSSHGDEARVVYLTVFPEKGELLCGSFTAHGQCQNFVLSNSTDIMMMMERWNRLIDQNHASLHATKDVAVIHNLSEKQRREWWKQRQQLDDEIKEMLHEFEQLLAPVKSLFGGDHDANDDNLDADHCGNNLSMMSRGDLGIGKSMIEEEDDELDRLVSFAFDQIHIDDNDDNDDEHAVNISALTAPAVTAVDYDKLKVTELKDLLKLRELYTTGKKAELVDRLNADDRKKLQPPQPPATTTKKQQPQTAKMRKSSAAPSTATKKESADKAPSQSKLKRRDHHIILFLDEVLQAFPIESIPILRNRSCSRCLGLVHLLSLILEPTQTAAKDINKCWYAVDVDNNLPDTRKIMMPFFEEQSRQNGWQGYVGEVPSTSVIRKHQAKNDLFIYCGHGAGVALHGLGYHSNGNNGCSNSVNDEVSVDKLSQKTTCPAALLWGCSSGRLLRRGHHDPYGPIITYLQHGASFAAANLWDVTDRDLDRMSLDCMQHFFHTPRDDSEGLEQNQRDIANCLTSARAICKMRFVVGAAAINYGLPGEIKFSNLRMMTTKRKL